MKNNKLENNEIYDFLLDKLIARMLGEGEDSIREAMLGDFALDKYTRK